MKKILLLLLFLASPLEAVTRYVHTGCTGNSYNPTGASGAGSCTGGSSTVYSTITTAINAANMIAGDILDIRAGTYAETINYQNLTYRPVGTSWANAPMIVGHAFETVTIRGVIIYGNAAWKYIWFDNLIIDAAESTNEAVNIGSGDLLTAPSFVRFTDCEAKNSNAAGGVQFARAFGCEWIGDAISGNSAGRIRDNGNVAGQNHGIYIYGLNSIIDGAEITGNYAYGVHAHSAASATGNNGLIVRNSHIHDNGVGGTANSPAGILVHGSSNALVYNNIIEGNPHGIALGTGFGSVDNAGIYNNSVYANTFNGIWNRNSTLNSTIQNNITYSNGTNILDTGSGTTTCTSNLGATVIGCVTHATPTSPFTNAAADIFTLAAGSIAVGNGTPKTLIFNTDIAGTTRTIPWDIGAYKAAITSNLTLNVPDASGISWQIGSTQTVTWTSTGNSGSIDITEDRDGNGSYETLLADNTTDDGSHNITVGGSVGSSRKMQVCDADGSPCDFSSNTYAVTVAAGGSGTVIISDNTSGTHIGTITDTDNALMAQNSATTIHQGISGVRANKFDSTSHTHTVLKFPTSTIPTTATITNAVLGLYRLTGTGSFSIDIRNVKRAWVQSQTTWDNYATGNAWTTGGGIGSPTDRDSTVLCNMSINADTPQYYTCSSAGLTAWAQSLVNLGTPNNGVHLERNGAESTILGTFASNIGDSDKRPYLSLTYTTVTSTISVVEPTAQDGVFPDKPIGIRWGSQGVSGNVQLLLSRDGGISYPEIIVSSILYNSPDYVWTATAGVSNNCKVKVVSLNNTSVFGESAPFRIRGRKTGVKQ